MSHSQKVAIVTGASQGLGAAIVAGYRNAGFAVIANSRNIKPSSDTGVIAVPGDIASRETAQKLIDTAIERFGRVDTLINNAGIFIGKPFTEYTADDLARMLQTNIHGFFDITQLAIPEMLITGREREFWEFWIKAETYNPYSISDEAIDEWISCLKAPGGLRGCLESYRACLKNARINNELTKTKITQPVLTVSATEFFGPLIAGHMRQFAEKVERSEVFDECGHSLAIEAEHKLANPLREFMLNR